MGWLSVVATGLAVRGAARRRQRRAEDLARARELDRLRERTEESRGDYEIWPPEAEGDR